MEKKLVIPFGEYEIIAEICDVGSPELPPELTVYIRDKNGVINQDLCLVRPHYDYKNGEFKTDNNFVDCLIWGDPNDEDYTDQYVIDVYKEEE